VEWRGRLYRFLSDDDYDRMVTKPVRPRREIYIRGDVYWRCFSFGNVSGYMDRAKFSRSKKVGLRRPTDTCKFLLPMNQISARLDFFSLTAAPPPFSPMILTPAGFKNLSGSQNRRLPRSGRCSARYRFPDFCSEACFAIAASNASAKPAGGGGGKLRSKSATGPSIRSRANGHSTKRAWS
jgi:hypothetical protein